ncbi:hypothetical protein [uncultured Methylobacterium sp.]|jgi:hypothetical protein|uniref:hypothetical protein n=1 Tax=uncultured Methylobacterium sp. TaxID=157278 RepID=UPI00260A2613|nr:hypothetical protein [uncultured Methylobacterium sp.]
MQTDPLREFVPDYQAIAAAMRVLVEQSHGAMLKAGWWTDVETGRPLEITRPIISEKIALIHSELSEALEGHRKNLPDDKLPHRPGLEVEMADAILRDTDTVGVLGLTEEAVQAMIALMVLPRPAVALAKALRSISEMAGELGFDLPGAVAEKAAFNAVRKDHTLEARRAAGGKVF